MCLSEFYLPLKVSAFCERKGKSCWPANVCQALHQVLTFFCVTSVDFPSQSPRMSSAPPLPFIACRLQVAMAPVFHPHCSVAVKWLSFFSWLNLLGLSAFAWSTFLFCLPGSLQNPAQRNIALALKLWLVYSFYGIHEGGHPCKGARAEADVFILLLGKIIVWGHPSWDYPFTGLQENLQAKSIFFVLNSYT